MPTISHISISSSDVVIGKGRVDLPPLKRNQIIDAKIKSVISSNKVKLQILGKIVVAKTHVPLMKGDSVRLKVTRTDDQLVLKFVEKEDIGGNKIDLGFLKSIKKTMPHKEIDRLQNLIHQDKELLDAKDIKLTDQLIKLTKTISLKSDDPDINMVKELIRSGGLNWESKVISAFQPEHAFKKTSVKNMVENDLKGLALKLMHTLKKGDSDIGETVKTFVNNLENLQLLNQMSFNESGKLLIPIPILFGHFFKFGQILLDLGKNNAEKKDRNERMIKVSFILEMSVLKNVFANFSVLKKSISGSFGVENKDMCSFVKNNIPTLKKKFVARGFDVMNIDCHVIPREKLETMSFVEKIVERDNGLLSLIV